MKVLARTVKPSKGESDDQDCEALHDGQSQRQTMGWQWATMAADTQLLAVRLSTGSMMSPCPIQECCIVWTQPVVCLPHCLRSAHVLSAVLSVTMSALGLCSVCCRPTVSALGLCSICCRLTVSAFGLCSVCATR